VSARESDAEGGAGAGEALAGASKARAGAVDPAFWRGRRVLLTGHTGFKGAWLALWLQSLGASVTGFAKDVPTQPSLYELARVQEGMDSVSGDVRDYGALAAAVAHAAPEVVIHMAAQSLVRRSFAQPRETYETNVIGTVNVLDAVRLQGREVRALVSVTSDKCYENREWEWGYREDEPMGGHDPYSSSKGAAELVIAAFRRSFFTPARGERDGTPDAEEQAGSAAPGTPDTEEQAGSAAPGERDGAHGARVASARAGNVIGGGDWGEDRLLPDIMRAALAGEEVPVRNPGSIRPWQHVLNPLSGYLVLAQALWQSPEHARGWNFGPPEQDARPVSWIVRRVGELWPGGVRATIDDGPHPHEASYLKLDSSRARQRLGWAPLVGLEQGIEQTVRWYLALQGGEDMRQVTHAQIEAAQYAPARS